MEFIELVYKTDSYHYKKDNSAKMGIIGLFLLCEVCSDISFYKEWTLNKKMKYTNGNVTAFEKENGYVLISDMYPVNEEEKNPTIVKMTEAQFVQLLDDWEKVCKEKPQEIMIIYENDTYTINVVQ